ncbi:MAG TPA: tyrosine-protein phosphatase [Candidatus Ligilactobacillus excrementipullorum]|nr:tyrosine-protein phosphatase [Candidatus Ligilactobacillus excrementipullorum]
MENKRMLAVKFGVNFREMGGYPTKTGQLTRWRKLLRSGNLGELTDQDVNYLQDYGLKYIVDLRSESESGYFPDKVPAGAQYYNLSVYPFASSLFQNLGVAGSMKLHSQDLSFVDESYAQMLADPHAQHVFRNLFQLLLQNDQVDESLVFHCAAGKDRTGVGGFLILNALQVKPDAILKDYLLTNLYYSNASVDMINGILTDDDQDSLANALNSNLAVASENFDVLYHTANAISGSVENYLQDKMKLSDRDLEKLNRLYLQDK